MRLTKDLAVNLGADGLAAECEDRGEPWHGVCLQGKAQVPHLISSNLMSSTLYPPHQSLPTVYFPVLWFQSTASLPETMAGPLLVLVNLPTILVMAASCCIVLGLLGMVVIYHRVRKAR